MKLKIATITYWLLVIGVICFSIYLADSVSPNPPIASDSVTIEQAKGVNLN